MKKSEKSKLKEWTEKDFKNLSLPLLQVINVFIKTGKEVLNSDEIKIALKGKLEEKKLGSALASFSKVKKREPIIFLVIKLNQRKTVWEINKKYVPILKEYLKKVEKYL